MIALQVKTSYSILGSLCHIDLLVSRAKELGYTSLAITDENNMFGVMEFYNSCQKNDIKPIIGIELDVLDKKILLYAENNNGYKNLIKLSTLISERDITIDDLIKYKDDLLLIMHYQYLNDDIFNIYEDRYIGFTNIRDCMEINAPKVYINNIAYLNKDDYKYLDYLYMIKNNKVLGDYVLNTHIGRHLMTKKELEDYIGNDIIDSMDEIALKCNVDIGYTNDLLPIYNEDIDSFEYLKNLCHKGLKRRLNNEENKEYESRLDYELEIINKMGFCNYFLIVYDYVKYAKQHDILVGPGRGSAAGSLACFTLGITDIDPIKYDLLFERFLNPERVTMPDIDIDFDADKRNEVINYVTSKYGEKKVAGIITFNTLGAKQVIRDVARVMNINLSLVDEISKLLTDDLKTSVKNNEKLHKLVSSSGELQKLFKVAVHLENLPRHVSVHAAGIIMCRKNIDEVIPLYKNQLGMYICAYSMNYLEGLGLLKMDFLGLSNLTLISNLISEIREKEQLNITLSNITLEDKKSLQIFRNVNTDGIFQFESPGMKKFLAKLKVNSFEDIVLALALYRPGPMDSIDTFIKRREGHEKIDYIVPELKDILTPTSGIIIYQEQIMQIVRILGNYTLAEADILRRAMSKKKEDILVKEKPRFISKCISNGYSEEIANQVYSLILKFANYGFNRSHSVAYAMLAYKMAFLKTYFYKYFMTNLLTNAINNDTKTKIYIYEVRNNNELILNPNINISTSSYIATSSGIICPLSIIIGIGTALCNEIIKEREKELFTSFISFVVRMYSASINRKVITNLILAGCFNDYNKRTLINNLDIIINYADISKDSGLIKIEVPEIIEYDEYTKEELINYELQVFGFYLTEHPVSKYKNSNSFNSSMIPNLYDRNIDIILCIESIKEVVTKNNDVMAFIKGNDEMGSVSLTLFPKTYERYKDLTKNNIVKVFGRVEKRFDKYQMVVNRMDLIKE